MTVDKHPVEENVQDIAYNGDEHCITGVSHTLCEGPYHIEHYAGGHRPYHYAVILLGISKYLRVLPHVAHKWHYAEHKNHYQSAYKGIQQKAVGKEFCNIPVFTFAVALPYVGNHSLGEAGTENESYSKHHIGKPNTCKLAGSQVANHNVVCKLHNHLAGLGNHYRKGQ